MAGLGALATQFFKKSSQNKDAGSRKPGTNRGGTKSVSDGRRSRDPKDKYRGGRIASETSSSSSHSHSGRGNSGPTRSARSGPRRQRESDPIPVPPRRTTQRSREGAFHSDRPRRASRKHDWGYDSGYASAEETRSDGSRVSDSYRQNTRKGTAGRRRRGKG